MCLGYVLPFDCLCLCGCDAMVNVYLLVPILLTFSHLAKLTQVDQESKVRFCVFDHAQHYTQRGYGEGGERTRTLNNQTTRFVANNRLGYDGEYIQTTESRQKMRFLDFCKGLFRQPLGLTQKRLTDFDSIQMRYGVPIIPDIQHFIVRSLQKLH